MENQKKVKWIEGILVTLVIIVSVMLIGKTIHSGYEGKQEKVYEVSEGWYYYDGERKVDVVLPAKIVQKEGEELLLYNDSIGKEYAGRVLSLKGAKYHLRVYAGEDMLYEYEEEGFPRNRQMKSKLDCDVRLPNVWEGALTLSFEDTENGKYDLPAIYIGTGDAVLKHHIVSNIMTIAIVLSMGVLSIISIIISICLRRINMKDRRFEEIAYFLILCGIWCITDSALGQNLSGMSPLVCYISFYAFMLFGIPMLHFIKNTGDMARHKILDVCICLFYANVILQSILRLQDVFEFIDMLFVTHFLLITAIVISGALLIKEYKEKKTRELLNIIIAFIILSLVGIIAIILYWIFAIPFYEMIYESGIVLFIILLMIGVIVSNVGNLRFKTEMQVYQRLSKEDRLTGMQNRRAFEEKVSEIEENASSYDNVALIFMDINRLKTVNDHFGHSAGDELIISTAKCIMNAFGSAGSSFRIGGDEFCTILINPQGDRKEWYLWLDKEILKHNKNSRYRLAIARGASYLKEPDGRIKTVSDWKYEADQEMYKDKGWTRVTESKDQRGTI